MPELRSSDVSVGLDNPNLSMNMSGVTDYGAVSHFLDVMKSMRPWLGHEPGKWGGVNLSELKEGGYLDADGWLMEIPEGLTRVSGGWQWGSGGEEKSENVAGVYTAVYEGAGDIRIGGNVKILEKEEGRIVFETNGKGTVSLDIYETDPQGTGNYIRDIHIVNEKHQDLYDAGGIFDPLWIEKIGDIRDVRFMDWMGTNNSKLTSWDDMPSAKGPFEGRVAIEDMVSLANQIGADPWFCMPHLADDDFIREFATYVRDNLDPDLTVRVEFSNEVWNWSFGQTSALRDMGSEAWGTNDSTAALLGYHSKRATETALIWEEVFGEDGAGRLVNVMGSQTVNSWITERLIEGTFWKNFDPEGFVDPKSVFEEVAITTYFGGKTVSDEKLRLELVDKIQDPDVDAAAWLADKLLNDATFNGSIPFTEARFEQQASVIHELGLKMVAYEGGQHIHHYFGLSGITEEQSRLITEFMGEFMRSEEMGELYQASWESWARHGDGPYMQFADVTPNSKWGMWGLYESLTDSSPRSDRFEYLNETSENWWGGEAKDAYGQGVFLSGTGEADRLAGTSQEDFLLGGAGDDVFAPGAGNDSIHGGSGSDIVLLLGSIVDYSIEMIPGRGGNAYHLKGPDGTAVLVDIEYLQFETSLSENKPILIGEFAAEKEASIRAIADAAAKAEAKAAAEVKANDEIDAGTSGAQPLNLEDQITYYGPNGTLIDADASRIISFVGTDSNRAGVEISSINTWSSLSKQIGQPGGTVEWSHSVTQRGLKVDFGGVEVGASYLTIHENKSDKGGLHLTESALETALRFGSVIKNASEIKMTEYDDRFWGRGEETIVHAGAGNDMLSGGDGMDVLYGDDGNDYIDGGRGNDHISGGAGSDSLKGGSGTDSFIFFAGDGNDRIIDFDHDDQLVLDGWLKNSERLETIAANVGGNLVFTSGDDKITFAGLSTEDLAWMSVHVTDDEDTMKVVTVTTSDGLVDASGESMVVLAAGGENQGGLLVQSTNVWSLLGSELGLRSKTEQWSYSISDRGVRVDINGVSVDANYWVTNENKLGRDTGLLTGSALETALQIGAVVKNASVIQLSDFDDVFHGREEDSEVHGGAGRDLLSGGAGDDRFYGDNGNDTILGGDGEDILDGGKGGDYLSGGKGADSFVFGINAGRDVISDFSAEDTLVLVDWLGEGRSLRDAASEVGGNLVLSAGDDSIVFRGLTLDDFNTVADHTMIF